MFKNEFKKIKTCKIPLCFSTTHQILQAEKCAENTLKIIKIVEFKEKWVKYLVKSHK